MKPLQRVLLGTLAVIGLFVGFLALRTRPAPRLPADRDHAGFSNAPTCLVCHAPGTIRPRSKNHPLGDNCLRCHGMP